MLFINAQINQLQTQVAQITRTMQVIQDVSEDTKMAQPTKSLLIKEYDLLFGEIEALYDEIHDLQAEYEQLNNASNKVADDQTLNEDAPHCNICLNPHADQLELYTCSKRGRKKWGCIATCEENLRINNEEQEAEREFNIRLNEYHEELQEQHVHIVEDDDIPEVVSLPMLTEDEIHLLFMSQMQKEIDQEYAY